MNHRRRITSIAPGRNRQPPNHPFPVHPLIIRFSSTNVHEIVDITTAVSPSQQNKAHVHSPRHPIPKQLRQRSPRRKPSSRTTSKTRQNPPSPPKKKHGRKRKTHVHATLNAPLTLSLSSRFKSQNHNPNCLPGSFSSRRYTIDPPGTMSLSICSAHFTFTNRGIKSLPSFVNVL